MLLAVQCKRLTAGPLTSCAVLTHHIGIVTFLGSCGPCASRAQAHQTHLVRAIRAHACRATSAKSTPVACVSGCAGALVGSLRCVQQRRLDGWMSQDGHAGNSQRVENVESDLQAAIVAEHRPAGRSTARAGTALRVGGQSGACRDSCRNSAAARSTAVYMAERVTELVVCVLMSQRWPLGRGCNEWRAEHGIRHRPLDSRSGSTAGAASLARTGSACRTYDPNSTTTTPRGRPMRAVAS